MGMERMGEAGVSVVFSLAKESITIPYVAWITDSNLEQLRRSKRLRCKYVSAEYLCKVLSQHSLNPVNFFIKGDNPSLFYDMSRDAYLIDLRDRYLFAMNLPQFSVLIREWNNVPLIED